MGHTVTGKLNEQAKNKQLDNGDVMFFVKIGERNFDHKTKLEAWSNYDAALYAKAGPQAEMYFNSFVQGAIVSVTGTGILTEIWTGNNGNQGVNLSLCDAKLAYVHSPSHNQQAAPQQAAQPQQGQSGTSGQAGGFTPQNSPPQNQQQGTFNDPRYQGQG